MEDIIEDNEDNISVCNMSVFNDYKRDDKIVGKQHVNNNNLEENFSNSSDNYLSDQEHDIFNNTIDAQMYKNI